MEDPFFLTLRVRRQEQPLVPSEDRRIGTITLGQLGWVWLDLMPAATAPNHYPQLSLRPVAERHRRSGLGFHRLAPDIGWPWAKRGDERRINGAAGRAAI
jgi:hypothetical protein